MRREEDRREKNRWVNLRGDMGRGHRVREEKEMRREESGRDERR